MKTALGVKYHCRRPLCWALPGSMGPTRRPQPIPFIILYLVCPINSGIFMTMTVLSWTAILKAQIWCLFGHGEYFQPQRTLIKHWYHSISFRCLVKTIWARKPAFFWKSLPSPTVGLCLSLTVGLDNVGHCKVSALPGNWWSSYNKSRR